MASSRDVYPPKLRSRDVYPPKVSHAYGQGYVNDALAGSSEAITPIKKPLHRDEEAAGETSYLVSRGEDGDFDDRDDSVEVVIWLRDRKGIHVNLEGQGHLAEAADLFEIIVSHRGLPKDAHNIFSLWLVSPLLELRLKDKHKPFHFAQLWDEFCAMYTDSKAEEISRDEPVVMFQRNVFLSLEDEMKISNDSALALLFYEAKYNVIEGRYVMKKEDFDTLAGIQALIQYGYYTEGQHDEEHYKKDIKMFYPAHLFKASKPSLIPGTKKHKEPRLEETIAASHKEISSIYRGEELAEYLPDLYIRYLKICWTYPFYGSAFFEADIEKPHGKLQSVKSSLPFFGGLPKIETWVAINTDGICLIDREKSEVLLAVPYSHLSWNLDLNEEDEALEPCLLIQFLHKENQDEIEVTKVLQVYSRQARLMDALIDSCVKRQLQRQQSRRVETDGVYRNVDFCGKITNKLDRLCLATYSLSGENLS